MPSLEERVAELDKQILTSEDRAKDLVAETEAEAYDVSVASRELPAGLSVPMQLELRRLRLLLQRESLMKAVAERSVLWSDPALPVCWENSAASFATERAWVEDAAQTSWAKNSAVSFEGWGGCKRTSRGIRIAVDNQGEALTDGLGKQLDGLRNGLTLRFDFSDWNRSCRDRRETCVRAIAVHEFGHALGLTHEQNRDEAEGWCADLADEDDFSGDWSVTIYDPDSIMNYCSPKYLRDASLSELDIEAVQTIYGRA